MRGSEEAEIFVAATSAVFEYQGQRYQIIEGKTTARRGAKILKAHEGLFKPLVIDFDVPQEPKRGPGRPRKHPLPEQTDQPGAVDRGVQETTVA